MRHSFLAIAVSSAIALPALATDPAPFILVDQFGYRPDMAKRAVIRNPQIGFDAEMSFRPGGFYALVDIETGEVVHSAPPTVWNVGTVDPDSGDQVWHFDFSEVQAPGSYLVRDIERKQDSDPFVIADDVYAPVLSDAFKALYYQRAGFEKREPFVAEGYTDAASHLGPDQDKEARRYDAKDDPDTERDLRGGWYDAGDYNQYTSWTANYISTFLTLYIEHPAIWTDDMGIPESGNGIPDVLDEAAWGLAWLERMQNADGSMLSVLGRSEGSPPSATDGPSYYGPENTSATVTAAGTFALAAEVFGGHPDLKAKASDYGGRAMRAWRWADSNPDVKFYNNSEEQGSKGLAAGQQEVEADRLAKKALIATAQMYGLTGDPEFLNLSEDLYGLIGGIDAQSANGFEGELAFTLLALVERDSVPESFRTRVRTDYAAMMEAENGWKAIESDRDPYGAFVDGYWWGSSGVKSRRGSVYSQASKSDLMTRGAEAQRDAAAGYLHYLHGVNPMGLVYLTNMNHAGAERSVTTLYHAWFKDGSEDFDSTKTSPYGPAPGLVVGGPNASYDRDPCCSDVCGGYGAAICERPILSPPTGQPPAKSYAEFNDGWPLNSWSVTENSLGYQSDYLRLLAAFVD